MKYFVFYISCILYTFNSNAATINNQHQFLDNINANIINSATDGIKLPTPSFQETSKYFIQTHVDSIINKVDEACNNMDQEQGIRVQTPSIFMHESGLQFTQLSHGNIYKLQNIDINDIHQIDCNKGFVQNSTSNTCKQQYRQFVKLLRT